MTPSLVVTLWWLCFWTAVGLGIGSFLNVVVHRLPRNRSLRDPLWSACPHCDHRIRWYDNLPILSFLLLRGRCRDCGATIATRYVVIEASMAVVVLMLLDAFFIGHVRAGLWDSPFGLTEELVYDWPIFLAHIILFACLLSMSVIDLEHYWVDVRFTNFAVISGFLLHILWTPRHSLPALGNNSPWDRPSSMTALMSIAAVAGLAFVWIVRACQTHAEVEELAGTRLDADTSGLPELAPSAGDPARIGGAWRPAAWLSATVLVGGVLALAAVESGARSPAYLLRAAIPLFLFFVLIVREGSIVRDSDQRIAEAIHEERQSARRMVLGEFVLLFPAVLFATAAILIMCSDGELPRRIDDVFSWRTRISGLSMLRSWAPLQGLATAAAGYVIGGAVGWAVRIFFTLWFGREAFGTGDIHLMAAAGCVAGWPIVLLGFVLTCGLAMIGWLLCLPFKKTRTLPLGPWLSLAFLIVVVFYEPIRRTPTVRMVVATAQWLVAGDSQWIGLEVER